MTNDLEKNLPMIPDSAIPGFSLPKFEIWERFRETISLLVHRKYGGTTLQNKPPGSSVKPIKQNDEMSRLIMGSSPDAIVCIEPTGCIAMWSRQAEKIFGWTEEEMTGKHFAETIIPEKYRRRHTDRFIHCIKTGNGRVLNKLIEISALNRLGKEFPIELTITPIKQNNREFFCAFIRDITARKNAEEQLLRERNLLRTAIDNLPDYIYAKDTNLNYIIGNRALVELVGANKEEEIIGKNSLQLFGSEIGHVNLEEDSKVIASGEPVINRDENITSNAGKNLWLLTNKVPLKDKDGNISGLIGISRDITERKKAEKDLKENEEKYRLLFSNNPMPMWVYDAKTYKILDVNEAATTGYGYSVDEFLNMTALDLRPHEEIKKFTDYFRVSPRGLINAGVWMHKRKDGSVIEVEVNSHDIIYDSKPCRVVLANEVTEKLKAQRQIIESEKKYRALFENNLAGVFQTNSEGKIINCNNAFAHMLGYDSHSSLEGKPADILYYYKGDRDKYLSTLSKEGQLINYELILKHVEERPVYVMANISLSTDTITGEKIIEGVMLDITDRKLAEEKVAESELRFRALVENCNDAITVIDENFITRYRSPSLCKMLGWEDDQKLHKHLSETVHTDDMKNIVLLKDKLLKYPGRSFPITFRSKHISGSYVWMEGVATNMLHNKYVNGIIANFRDITDRKKAEESIKSSEEKYRQIVETAQEGIWVIDENSRTTFVNKKMCEILEYDHEEMIGKDIYFFMDREGKKSAAESMKRKKEGHAGQRLFKYISKTGKEVWTNISANPLFNEDGTYKGALAMITDITEKVKLQQQLMDEQINQQKEITKAAVNAQEKERREIGEELHDNVNQLLAASRLYLNHSLNSKDDFKPFVLKSHEYVSSAIEEIRKLTKALVGPAKEEAMGLIASVTELISDIIMVKDIKINFKHSSYNEERSDAALKVVIYRIIQEQLNNILKHAEASRVEITLTDKNDHVELIIKDNGKGFDTAAKKTGIGLKNIQNRAQIYDGNVEIISSPGKGCELKTIFQNSINKIRA